MPARGAWQAGGSPWAAIRRPCACWNSSRVSRPCAWPARPRRLANLPGHARPARRRSPPTGKTARSAARSPPPRRRPGRCCGCGGSRGPIAARCWPDSC
ncbi:Uncharacterised protein [Bordetella pertussis]|nr:Uncharacterised protein [Bordetella pertussis]